MTYSEERLKQIFEKTSGYCYYCDKKLAWGNYGNPNGKAGWEVDHSKPVSKGGSDHLNNLVPSCIPCNRNKGDSTSRQYRQQFIEESDDTLGGLISGLIIIVGFIYLLSLFKNGSKRRYPQD